MVDGITQFGFDWGPAAVTRYGVLPEDRRVIRVKTAHRTLHIHVSATGRSVRVFEPGNGELLLAPEANAVKVTGPMVDAALMAASSNDHDHGHTDCFCRVVLQAALDAYDPGDEPLPPCDCEDPAAGANENAAPRQEQNRG